MTYIQPGDDIRCLEGYTEPERTDGVECPICCERIHTRKPAIMLRCRHALCATCLIKWLKQSHLCPFCRTPMFAMGSDGRKQLRHIDICKLMILLFVSVSLVLFLILMGMWMVCFDLFIVICASCVPISGIVTAACFSLFLFVINPHSYIGPFRYNNHTRLCPLLEHIYRISFNKLSRSLMFCSLACCIGAALDKPHLLFSLTVSLVCWLIFYVLGIIICFSEIVVVTSMGFF